MRLHSVLFCLTFSTAAVAKGCSYDGFQECVTYYADSDCHHSIGNYIPTCEGNCFQFSSFQGLVVEGNFIHGTDCIVYSDPYCQNEIGVTPNAINQNIDCLSYGEAQSMKCYFDC
ncbi:uncharacterized protein BO95DRAFT_494400 [Aspergillus brunneoviolaceus CBS 621.78]|uniref:Uncharacterized protein n=2 Tax=Aspergillus TaxID=5052 RepID=A0A8G1RFH0_9EURO|nr:hypothetical protein BO95DRAFT_494400 [Aspergillus brunneoviolaceus CBS 621.78]XP_040796306.1 uncharacterized protein BO72DRAFT_521123 [Aspergillus fijiensis CBS 313.89]RAH46659.1 hypothetical protein BO95DRAFT_494400 [Aspergillus brunneoviolaceus CBS 621.78]RAK72294.1 hypothetical protein BO72DRAFT_521123 [Aspergillus fijiensis CBS 313.89]